MTPAAIHERWDELIGRAIDGFAALNRSEPGFRAILVNWRMSADILFTDNVNVEFARRAESVLATQAPRLTPARRALVATIVVEVVSAMLLLGVHRPRPEADLILAETKTLLLRYLAPIVTEEASAPAKREKKSERGRKSERGK